MSEITNGLYVKDYKDLDVTALEEMIQLDNQLDENLKKIMSFLAEEDYTKALTNLRWLIEDNLSHRDYSLKCQDEIIYDMECTDASNHFEDYMNPPIDDISYPHTTPCDYEDYEGNHTCPYDAQGGDDCRRFAD